MMQEINRPWSAEEFLECRFDLPESGQWSELIEGEPVHLQPPDLDHGNTLLNLSKALAEYAHSADGYACFGLGLLLGRDPDTVLFPAVSYFVEGDRFAELDRQVTETVPALVIELASTADRRRQMAGRIRSYLSWGVPSAWVIDPAAQSLVVTLADHASDPIEMTAGDLCDGGPVLEGFQTPVAKLFAEPDWWP